MTTYHPTATTADELLPFPASLDNGTMERLEKRAGSTGIGQARRLSLLVCSRDSETLARIYNETPDMFETLFDSVETFREHTKGLSEMAEAAYVRLLLVGQNPPVTGMPIED